MAGNQGSGHGPGGGGPRPAPGDGPGGEPGHTLHDGPYPTDHPGRPADLPDRSADLSNHPADPSGHPADLPGRPADLPDHSTDHSTDRPALTDLPTLAARLRTLPPSCGPVRLIAVDGHAGSGKSTFAGRLAAACGGVTGDAPVVHLDDLATHEELFAWQDRLRRQVLTPLAAGRTAEYGVYDWVRRTFAERRVLRPSPVVILEGVGAGRRAVRPYLACLLWMELASDHSWERGRRRDGPELTGFWDGWIPAERQHFAADPSRPYADLLVHQRQRGYEVLPGPAAAG